MSQAVSEIYSEEARAVEDAFLGEMLIHWDEIPKASGIVQPEHFWPETRRTLWKCMADVRTGDLAIVAHELRKRDQIKQVGGITELVRLSAGSSLARQWRPLAARMLEIDYRRRISLIAREIAQTGQPVPFPPRPISSGGWRRADSFLDPLPRGRDWGRWRQAFEGFDIPRGAISAIGARTSVGKTTFACSAAVAIGDVTYCTAEDGAEYVAGQINAIRDEYGGGNPEVVEAKRLRDLCAVIRLTDSSVIVVDHLQDVSVDNFRGTEVERKNHALEQLREAVQSEGKHLFLLAQLNRGPVRDGQKAKPTLADFKDTGKVEEAARLALLLSRDEQPGSRFEDFVVEVAKNTRGPKGHVNMRLDKAIPAIVPRGADLRAPQTHLPLNDEL